MNGVAICSNKAAFTTAIKQVGKSGLYANELSKMQRCSGEMTSYNFAETTLYDIEVIKA